MKFLCVFTFGSMVIESDDRKSLEDELKDLHGFVRIESIR